jgi:hypothetical protein
MTLSITLIGGPHLRILEPDIPTVIEPLRSA